MWESLELNLRDSMIWYISRKFPRWNATMALARKTISFWKKICKLPHGKLSEMYQILKLCNFHYKKSPWKWLEAHYQEAKDFEASLLALLINTESERNYLCLEQFEMVSRNPIVSSNVLGVFFGSVIYKIPTQITVRKWNCLKLLLVSHRPK